MKFAYADPPYIGQAKRHYAKEAAEDGRTAREVNHSILIGTLTAEYDAWALSASSSSLRDILPLCPPCVRVMAWVKPFAVWKSVFPPYSWEPVLVKGGRFKSNRSKEYKEFPRWGEPVRDWVSASVGHGHNPAGERVPGAKPYAFAIWLFRVMGAKPEDDFHDIFPGSGQMQLAWDAYCHQWSEQGSLFEGVA